MHEPGGYKYDNLKLQSDKPTLYSDGRGGQSLCQFGPDQITIEESHAECSIKEFTEVVQTVLGGLVEDEIPPIFFQRVKIQCLSQVTHCHNSVELLAGKVSRAFGAIEPFERPPSMFGVRFRFPPVNVVDTQDDDDAEGEPGEEAIREAINQGRVEEKTGFVTLRLESYAKDRKRVWMEVAGAYPQFDEPLALADADKIIANIHNAYDFLTQNSKRFLDQFDTEEGN